MKVENLTRREAVGRAFASGAGVRSADRLFRFGGEALPPKVVLA